MKLTCACGQEFTYDASKAGQHFQCKWCKQILVMPPPGSLPVADQRVYREEINKIAAQAERKRQKELHEKELAARKEQLRIEKEKARIEANQVRMRQQAEAPQRHFNLLELLDFKFKRYLTPWIIRFVWVWVFCGLLLASTIHVAVCAYKSLPKRETVSIVLAEDVIERKRALDVSIMLKRSRPAQEERQNHSDNKMPSRNTALRRTEEVPRQDAPRVEDRPADWLEKYQKMALEQLLEEQKKLDSQFPTSKQQWAAWSFYYLFSALSSILAAILTLVALRVGCECVIVIFNIAESLKTLAHQAK